MFWQLREKALVENSRKQRRKLVALLYDRDATLRRECAFLVEELGICLKEEERRQLLFALQQFENLYENPEGRELLFTGLTDRNLRIRARILNLIHESDCRNDRQRALYFYGLDDYQELICLAASNSGIRPFIIQLLKKGSDERFNTAYHCRQCRDTLYNMKALEDTGEAIKALLRVPKSGNRSRAADPPQSIQPPPETALQGIIQQVERRGIYIDGTLAFPAVRVGTITNRVTYKNPGLQTWAGEKRESLLQPPPGCRLDKYDLVSIEPLLLVNFLLKEFHIALDEIPAGDLYLAVSPQDRGEGKRWLNRVINGGSPACGFQPTSFALRLLEALSDFRSELAERVRREGFVETIAGNNIPLEAGADNFSGKAVNRLVQGSAADFFHYGLECIDRRIQTERLAVQIYFLLYDEVWLATPRHETVDFTRELLAGNEHFQLLLPVAARRKGGD